MRDDQHRRVEPRQGLGQFPAGDGIEVGRRLVENEHLGFTRQNGGQCRAPALTTRHVGGTARGQIGHRHDLEGTRDTRFQFGAADPEVGGSKRDVLREGRHEQLVVGILEDHSDLAPDITKSLARQRRPGDLDSALRRGQHTVEMQHERGLAGTVRAEQRDTLPRRDLEIDTAERRMPARVRVGQVPDTDRGLVHLSTHAPAATITAAAAGSNTTVHCRGVAAATHPDPTASAGTRPSKPRDSIAIYTRSPRS